jgi:hypothetical protein
VGATHGTTTTLSELPHVAHLGTSVSRSNARAEPRHEACCKPQRCETVRVAL